MFEPVQAFSSFYLSSANNWQETCTKNSFLSQLQKEESEKNKEEIVGLENELTATTENLEEVNKEIAEVCILISSAVSISV